ncbi:MAG: kelch repeat-containing protein [bacterium]
MRKIFMITLMGLLFVPVFSCKSYGNVYELDEDWFSGEPEETVLIDADHTIQAFFKRATALSLPFSEDFSGVPEGELPADWTEAPNHSYCGVSNTNEAGGIAPEMKFSPPSLLSRPIRLITPKIEGNAVPDILLTFKHFVACTPNSPFHFYVQTSIDNGATWVDRYSLEVLQNIGPETVAIELDDLVGKEFHVSFLIDGLVVHSAKWCIDDVVIIGDYKGLLKGVVTNDKGPIEGAVITVVETGVSAVTGPTGEYELRNRGGNFTIECKAPGHYSEIVPDVEIIKNDEVNLDFCLTYPLANIHPTSFSVEQDLGESTDEYLYVENIGTGPLDFIINIDYSDKRSSRGIGDWLALSPVATFVHSPSSCFGDGKFFVIGGGLSGSSTIFNAIQIYDTLLGTWSVSSPMIMKVSDSVAEYYEGKVYVIGGTNSAYQTSDTVQIYDVSSDTWSAGASMPTPRSGASSGLIGGKIYSLCGYKNQIYPSENVAYEYDIAHNTWTTLTNGPVVNGTGISFGGGCAFNGKIYVGGHPDTYNQFYEFDPAGGGTWTAKAMIPKDLGGYKLRMVGLETEGIILAVGGSDDDKIPTGSTWSYDPETDTWTNLDKPMTTAVIGGACAAGYGKIYYYGGYGRSDHLEPAPFMMNTFYDPFWLTADTIWGSVDPGDTKIVTLTFDAGEVLVPGLYSTELAIIHNTDDGSLSTIPATMLVKTPTPECDYLGTHLVISQEDPFRVGDTFWLECHVCNNTDTPMQHIATAVLLGVYGEFWFWPGWSQDFDLEYHDYLPGLTEIQVFESFIWPEVQGTAVGLEFYSGLINAEMNDLIGDFGYLTFGYTDR